MIIHSETSRIRAALVDPARHSSFAEADAKLLRTNLSIHLTEDAARTPAGQAAFLTSVVTGSRCFGTVTAAGALEHPLQSAAPIRGKTLTEAAQNLGATVHPTDGVTRTILIGAPDTAISGWAVRAQWNGWIAGVVPAPAPPQLGRPDSILAGVAAGALAVGEAFLAEQGNVRAGRRTQSVSLWEPLSKAAGDAGPEHYSLPLQLWLVGLGNLGQAYLWSLSMLPYPEPGRVELFLQDDDRVRPENWGTSVLIERGRYGVLKTRVAEEWAEHRGFNVRRIDRRLDEHQRRQDDEPPVALAGLDRLRSRRLLAGSGFHRIVDVGLGATATDYCKFRINAFDSDYSPATHFAGLSDDFSNARKALLELPAYGSLIQDASVDACGAAQLAGIPAAAPFVSMFAGALALTQVIRVASGEAPCRCLTGALGDLDGMRGTASPPLKRPTISTVQA
jgi:hypothetical protein